MKDYYFVYNQQLNLFIRTCEGRFEHTMKEVTETVDVYKDQNPTAEISDIIIIINTKDVMFNIEVPWNKE